MNLSPVVTTPRSARPAMKDLPALVDQRLDRLLPSPLAKTDSLCRAMRYALLAPGKRLRPILTVLATWELGVDDLAALDAGCALEMVHAASLILDDLPAMDDAKVRRGQAATHLAFGEDVAMLAAIRLLSRAFGIVGSLADQAPSVRSALVGILSDAVGCDGLVGGQHRDLRRQRGASDMADLAHGNHLKTGLLFLAAVDMAGEIAAVRGDRLARLRTFATELGQAFQILDDLLDGEPSPEAIGKDVGQDGAKETIVSLLGPRQAQARLHHHVARALDGLDASGAGPGPLRAFAHQIFGPYASIMSA